MSECCSLPLHQHLLQHIFTQLTSPHFTYSMIPPFTRKHRLRILPNLKIPIFLQLLTRCMAVYIFPCTWRDERKLIRTDAYDGAVFVVEVADFVGLAAASAGQGVGEVRNCADPWTGEVD